LQVLDHVLITKEHTLAINDFIPAKIDHTLGIF